VLNKRRLRFRRQTFCLSPRKVGPPSRKEEEEEVEVEEQGEEEELDAEEEMEIEEVIIEGEDGCLVTHVH
jgi:hypothetical protein